MNRLNVILIVIGFIGALITFIVIYANIDNDKVMKICCKFILPVFSITAFCGIILSLHYNIKYYRYHNKPIIEDVNRGNASIDSIGVINNNVQYELNWIGDKTGKREQ